MKVLSNKFWAYRNEHVKYEHSIQFYKTFENKPYDTHEEAYKYWKQLILDRFYGTAQW